MTIFAPFKHLYKRSVNLWPSIAHAVWRNDWKIERERKSINVSNPPSSSTRRNLNHQHYTIHSCVILKWIHFMVVEMVFLSSRRWSRSYNRERFIVQCALGLTHSREFCLRFNSIYCLTDWTQLITAVRYTRYELPWLFSEVLNDWKIQRKIKKRKINVIPNYNVS